ncbi:MAG: hypothetical protein K5644_05335 [Lachnospiraceae bacterium]|nr:hypothetical protein [Lachnospiraceae bacterium]
MADVQEYKCPNCGGALNFDSGIQKMKCPFCDCEFEMDALKELDADLDKNVEDEFTWEAAGSGQWTEEETQGMKVYVCQSCGGEIVGDETMGATSCPYCDNPVVVKGSFAGDLKPDFIIPFKHDRNAAKEGLNKHLLKKFFLPKVFKDQNHIDEVKGLYVPFWLFDTDVDGQVNYEATKVRHWSDSNYDYTETSYFNVYRAGNIAFDKIPVDGSTQMPDDLMESVEPFDFNEATNFQTAYMAGYLADRYDVDDKQSINRANERVKQSTEDSFKESVVGYTTVTTKNSNIRTFNGKTSYAMYPVWILNTTYNDEKFLFAMNGQTGKFVGNLPLDKGKFALTLAGLTVGLTAIITLLQFLFY